jgi:hypothetical protein
LRLIFCLYTIQILSIALTSLVVSGSYLALLWPLLFVLVQLLLGWCGAGRFSVKPPVPVLLAGLTAQAPGIISALVIIKGILAGATSPDAFDFTIQIWCSPFTPLFALLPRTQYHGVPLYFLVTLLLPFVAALLPACGALLRGSSGATAAANQ